MRRIYESRAIDRDDRNPYHPNERDARTEPQAMRTIPAATLSRHVVPHWLRNRAISVHISIPQENFAVGESIPFVVTMKNSMPFPIEIPTNSPLVWDWYVDGHAEASHVDVGEPPDRSSTLSFARGERKQFRKHWNGMFRTGEHEWEPAPPGTYTISASIDVDDPERRGLKAATTVKIE